MEGLEAQSVTELIPTRFGPFNGSDKLLQSRVEKVDAHRCSRNRAYLTLQDQMAASEKPVF